MKTLANNLKRVALMMVTVLFVQSSFSFANNVFSPSSTLIEESEATLYSSNNKYDDQNLQIEDWMFDTDYFATPETKQNIKLEEWMFDVAYFENDNNNDGEEIELAEWMFDTSYFKSDNDDIDFIEMTDRSFDPETFKDCTVEMADIN